ARLSRVSRTSPPRSGAWSPRGAKQQDRRPRLPQHAPRDPAAETRREPARPRRRYRMASAKARAEPTGPEGRPSRGLGDPRRPRPAHRGSRDRTPPRTSRSRPWLLPSPLLGGWTPAAGGVFTRVPEAGRARLDPRLQLDLVPVRVTEVEGRPVAVGAIALDDTPLERDALLGERPGDVLEVLAADREADVVESSRGPPGAGGQEVDEVVAEAELDERQFLVHAIESAAEDLFVEAPGARLVAHPEHHVVEPE